ncbi:MAG: hypothetical protein LBH29_03205 [Elusimicrobiota bacterium]|jgi:hypothetical protein|nr:hypothetical protein [Elusimicrobiota bacterium]
MRPLNSLLFIFIVFSFTSCSLVEYPKRFLGYSTAKFTDAKTQKSEKVFATSKSTAFKKSVNIINKLKAQITHSNYKEGYIAAFNLSKYFDNCLDSTEIAVFFEEIDAESVKITIACNNSLLLRNFADKFFEMFAQKVEDWKI